MGLRESWLANAIRPKLQDWKLSCACLTPTSVVAHYANRIAGRSIGTVRPLGVGRDVWIRHKNSVDRRVLYYTFQQQFHRPPTALRDKAVILDLGANIGCSIIDLKLQYPDATVYGLEMHPANFELALMNTRELEDVTVLNKAAWVSSGRIAFRDDSASDAYSVSTDGGPCEVEVDAISIDDVLEQYGIEKVDYLKMDIEGAELKLLEDNNDSWLNRVDSFNIEFHGLDESQLNQFCGFFRSRGFESRLHGEHWASIVGWRST